MNLLLAANSTFYRCAWMQADMWKGFDIRDSNVITSQRDCSGMDTAWLLLEAIDRQTKPSMI